MSPRTRDKEKRRLEILDASLEVIAVQGAYSFKMVEVAARAGIGKGTIYEYFDTKEDLLTAGFARFFLKYFDFLNRTSGKRLSPPERLRDYFKRSFEFLADNSGMLQVMFDFWSHLQMQRRTEQFHDEIVEILDRFKNDFSAIFEDGMKEGYFRAFKIEPVMISLFAMVDGLALQYSMGQIDLRDAAIADELTEMVLRGLLHEEKGE